MADVCGTTPQADELRLAEGAKADVSSEGRSAFLAMLFRETDRAQRMKTSLSVLLIGLDEGRQASLAVGPLRARVEEHVRRTLRSYDEIAWINGAVLGAILPGCGVWDAAMLAERLRVEVFPNAGTDAWFAVAAGGGRSAGVVLREAEKSLETARAKRDSAECAGPAE